MSPFEKSNEEMEYLLATDVGSTTTKARFFSKRNGEWRFLVAGEAPTTVETPFEDVTLGVRNALREVEELTNHKILAEDGSGVIIPYDGKVGVDLYCTTSSAGGGLQMLVAGNVKTITAESANRAALGAGAIVMDVISTDDKREDYQKIRRIRNLRPDMILLAGGTDGGSTTHVLMIAQLIKAANPLPRLGIGYRLPLIYAGNIDARDEINKLLGSDFALSMVDNIRPVLETEVIEPARRNIHELFMEHVMSHAPGYNKLMKWTQVDIMPTPAGEGMAMQLIADTFNENVIGVGLGGATTNVYSIFDKRFVRSVSANLGMSYSICNVLKEAGVENIARWSPFELRENELINMLRNKMIRPTTIPDTLNELVIEHAVAREAIRLGVQHHKTIATRLRGIKVERDLADIFEQSLASTYIDMMKIKIIVGTGGLLSHAPRRAQALFILTDAFLPEGVTRIFQDSMFMMPHLGVLSTVYRDAAWQIFDKDCLVRLGTVIAPVGAGIEGEKAVEVKLELPDGTVDERQLNFGEITKIPLPERSEIGVVVTPLQNLDVGSGRGKKLETRIEGGVVGLVIDARGRPLKLPTDPDENRKKLAKWFRSMDLYSKLEWEDARGSAK
jgi:uncharacterized protein (TIGR01319 family)